MKLFCWRHLRILAIGSVLLALIQLSQAQENVILISLDGLGQQILEDDPAARELVNLHELRKRSFEAAGVQPAFPSTTANSHAAIWTGAYGDVSGIAGNWNPVLPRAEHTFLERRPGFRSESLLAEPLWVAAARQGLSVVAHQVTQVYPFTELSAGLSLKTPPLVLNSYQTRKVADYQVLRAGDVQSLENLSWNPPIGKSFLPPKHFTWKAGQLVFVASLVATAKGGGYDSMVIAEHAGGPRILVRRNDTESRWPRGRALARHFAESLEIQHGPTIAEFGPLSASFRLWETTPEGDFLLLAMPLQELGLAYGSADGRKIAAGLLREAGPLAGNGPSTAYLTGRLGKPLYQDGDGVAELRFLECMEFIARQYNRYSAWLWKRQQPRLFIDYFPFPDEMDHGWLGLSRETGDAQTEARARRFLDFRRRGYQIVDARIGALRQLASGKRPIIAVTSDHGMTPVTKLVNINAALREVGYLTLNEKGEIDATNSRATGDYAILLNTEDWKGGTIPLAAKRRTLGDLTEKLGALRDPETGKPLFTAFFTPADSGARLGIGGPAGFDLYFDLAPGYAPERKAAGPVVEALDVPRGRHGFLSTRPDMSAIFIARGGRLRQTIVRGGMFSTQIAPVVCQWLEIQPPRDAKAAGDALALSPR